MLKYSLVASAALLLSGSAFGDLDLSSMNTPHVDGEMIITFEDGVGLDEKRNILVTSREKRIC